MLQSRVSIPLIAVFIVTVAGCMLYLLNAGNIFNAHYPNFFSHISADAGDQQNPVSV